MLVFFTQLLFFVSKVYADNDSLLSNFTGNGQTPNPLLNLVPFALMFTVIYFLILRPQQKKVKETQEMLTKLKVGDEVITSSGIIGRINEVADKVIFLEVDQNIRFRCLKSKIIGFYSANGKSSTALE